MHPLPDALRDRRKALSAYRSMAGIARADFLERTRRYSFFLALLFAVFLGYATATGKIFLQFDESRGVYTSAWIGTLVALVITCFVSLTGFYIVKNSVERDRVSGVGQILAATPLAKSSYAFGKLLSNFAVLSAMVGVLALAAVAMQFLVHEDTRVDLWALLSPFLLIALPAVALTAALALAFEILPGLRGGFGNVAWFFVWNFALAAPILSGRRWLDPMGLLGVMDSLGGQARQYVPGYRGGMSFQIDVGQHLQVIQAWHWPGIAWNFHLVLLRLMWFGVACGLVAAVVQVFDRFDTATATKAANRNARKDAAQALRGSLGRAPVETNSHGHLAPLARAGRTSAFFRIFSAELRLALFGLRWWWYAVAIGLLIAEFLAPLAVSRGPVLASAWMWCVFVWSPMGARESRFATRGLLFSCAKVLPRQVSACFLAGLCVAGVMGIGAAVRLGMAGDAVGLLAWSAALALLPALALFLGISSGSSKSFEGLLTFVWYVGPMNHTPGLDFTGTANGAHQVHYAVIYLVVGALLLGCAFLVRARQLQSV